MSNLFVRELLLGPDALLSAQRSEISAFLRGVIEQRQFPQHLNLLWNALYYEWDLEQHSYSGASLNPDRIEQRRFDDTDRALPVGGFVRVPAGDDEVWAEVAYKEGRHPEVRDDGVVPAHVSGAVAAAVDGRVELREALVCDWQAFGTDFNSQIDLDRLCRRGQLDDNGHLLMNACYRPEQAELDDATYYAHYLLEHHRDGLLAEFVTDDVTDEELFAMLLNSFRAVEALASAIGGVRRWNNYYLWGPRYVGFVTDRSPSSPVGADFFASVFRSLTLPGSERTPVGYAAVGPTISDHLSSHGMNEEERAELSGPGWARLVCYVNTYVADKVREAPGASIVALGQRYHLRRDDAWQAGGVWRTERLYDGGDSAWSVYPPLLPLGLGSKGIDSGSQIAPPPTPPEPVPEPAKVGEREWVSVLTAGEIESEALRIPNVAIALLPRGTERPRLFVLEAGRDRPFLNALCPLDRRKALLVDVPWGIEVFGGIKLFCTIRRGSDVVRVETRRLATPIEIDGEPVEFEVDPAAFSGARRRRPLRPEERRRASSLAELISRAFVTRGEQLTDGGRVLHIGEVGTIVLGTDAEPAAWSPLLREIAEMDLERASDGRLIWRPRITRRTSLGEASRIASFARSEGGQRLRAKLRPHVVRMHHRRWDHKDPGTWEERAASYAADLRRYHAHGRLNPELPPGYTYVGQYEKGVRPVNGSREEEER